jgi:hypothetical protein
MLKGLSHEIFAVMFWLEWIYLGLNGNRFWFLNFKEGSSILVSYFKYCCVPYQTILEICRIFEYGLTIKSKVLQFFFFLGKRSSEKCCKRRQYFSEIRKISDNDLQLIPRFFENVLQQQKRVFKTPVNPSWRFYKSPRRFDTKHTKT